VRPLAKKPLVQAAALLLHTGGGAELVAQTAHAGYLVAVVHSVLIGGPTMKLSFICRIEIYVLASHVSLSQHR
jgi:hypothetical protein